MNLPRHCRRDGILRRSRCGGCSGRRSAVYQLELVKRTGRIDDSTLVHSQPTEAVTGDAETGVVKRRLRKRHGSLVVVAVVVAVAAVDTVVVAVVTIVAVVAVVAVIEAVIAVAAIIVGVVAVAIAEYVVAFVGIAAQ